MQIMSSLPRGVNVGDYVQVTTRSRPEYNQRLWLVHDEQSANGRVTLRRIANGNLNEEEECHQLIAVRPDAVKPVALVPAHVSMPVDANVATLQHFLGADGARNGADGSQPRMGQRGQRRYSPLNQWIPLPYLGCNSVMLRKATNLDTVTNVMYPALQGHELWFYSAWASEIIQLIDCGILRLCPDCQVWPWCSFCHNFLFPPEAHRGSKRHERCRHFVRSMPAEVVHMQVLARLGERSRIVI